MSDGFSVVVDDTKARLKFEKLPADVKGALFIKSRELQHSLLSLARARASGGLVGVRTGAYLKSIRGTTRQGKASVTSTVRSKSPLAAIIERGADIGAHDIMPTAAQALHFSGSAGDVFAAKVHHPEVRLPPKPVIEGAFDAMKEQIVAELSTTATESAKRSFGQ